MRPRVNKWLDLADRVGWTGIQVAGAALLTYLTTTDDLSWRTALSFVGYSVLLAVIKVVTGQNTGADDTGSLIGQPVIEPPPVEK